MEIDLPLLLTLAVLVSGLFWGLDRFRWRPRRQAASERWQAAHPDADPAAAPEHQALVREPAVVEYVGSFFPVLAIVLVLRSFLAEPFQIPSGSMVPTLLPGDFIVVNKFAYGLRLPVLNTKFFPVGEPQRGDVMVFVPPHKNNYFIKRVIGLPGDEIRYANKRLYINGELVEEIFTGTDRDGRQPIQRFTEQLGDTPHPIFKRLSRPRQTNSWQVPEGHYFMLGDNRDVSEDSRFWGFVAEDKIVGRAEYIWLYWPNWSTVPSFSRASAIR